MRLEFLDDCLLLGDHASKLLGLTLVHFLAFLQLEQLVAELGAFVQGVGPLVKETPHVHEAKVKLILHEELLDAFLIQLVMVHLGEGRVQLLVLR